MFDPSHALYRMPSALSSFIYYPGDVASLLRVGKFTLVLARTTLSAGCGL
jgi:hypothetical protein